MALTQTQVSQLYVAIFGRASEGDGNTYWQEHQDSMLDAANAMLDTDPAREYFGETLDNNQAFIEHIYENTLGKTVDEDPDGIAYWVSELDNGTSKAQVISSLIVAAQDPANAGDAQDQFNNKVMVSDYAAEHLAAFTSIEEFAAFINNVDHTAESVTAAEDAVDDAVPATTIEGFNITDGVAGTADIMGLTGDVDARIDFTNPANQVKGLDLDGDGIISNNGVENVITGVASDYEIVDAYARNPLNELDTTNNFLGDIAFDGTGFEGDGVSTDGNIVLGGLGVDTIYGGIGNDFLTGGGIAAARALEARNTYIAQNPQDPTGLNYAAPADTLSGGRNADFFFVELSALDATDGNNVFIDGGTTADDSAAGTVQTAQDADWLLFEGSDDDEPVTITLRDESTGQGNGAVVTRSGQAVGVLRDVENFDASGNLYGFLDDIDVEMGGRRVDDREVQNGTLNNGIGSSAQLNIDGSSVANIIVGGYDNDAINGEAGNDLLMGGNLSYLINPNLLTIINDGIDTLIGGAGADNIIFEADGGRIEGDVVQNVIDVTGVGTQSQGNDTLWLTNLTLGTRTAAEMTTDGVIRLDLDSQNIDAASGYGGADFGTRDNTANDTQDQTNYQTGVARTTIQDMENVIATGLGAADYDTDGTNSGDLSHLSQVNQYGYDGDLTLRGTAGVNTLYANTGDDVIEGRQGGTLTTDGTGQVITNGDNRDKLSGGEGNDDFVFSMQNSQNIAVAGDGVDVIHRQADLDGDNFWDGYDASTNRGGDFVQDFGVDSTVIATDSSFTLGLPSILASYVDGIHFEFNGTDYSIDGLTAVDDTFDTWVDNLRDALSITEGLDGLTVSSPSEGVVVITDPNGGDFTELADGWILTSGTLPSDGLDAWYQEEGAPTTEQTQDRLIYRAYEDRNDGEAVDDNAITGSSISLGTDSYAEDLVIDFSADGTRIAEDQAYVLTFANLTTEDTVAITVNDVDYMLKVGVDLDGNAIANEELVAQGGTAADQATIQANFLARMANFINTFMDNDTAAGQLNAAVTTSLVANDSITLNQVDYNGEETVFMSTPLVDLTNGSTGEIATVTVTNNSQHEVHLLDFDGTNGALNADNVLFVGNIDISRSNLVTALDAGETIIGTEAVVVDGGADNLESTVRTTAAVIDNNTATNSLLATDFTVHGDDLIIGGDGSDIISGGTGDDRVLGSLGTDTIDGGKSFYAVQVLGEDQARVYVMNQWEASNPSQVTALSGLLISSITQIADSEDDGTNFVAGAGTGEVYSDTLQFQQNDFTPGVSRFTITLNDFTTTAAGVVELRNGGAGTVGVDNDGDGVMDATTTFTNFENIRTVSGVGNAVAGDGQGNDTLDVSALSTATGGISYDLTNNATAGQVNYSQDSAINVLALEAGQKASALTGATVTSVRAAILATQATTDFNAAVAGISLVADGNPITVGAFLAEVSALSELTRPTSVVDDLTDNPEPVPDISDYETLVIGVDGVESVISGTGNDLLMIDETEAAKDNAFDAGEGVDRIEYQNDFNAVVEKIAQPTVTIKVNTGVNEDQVVMTAGRVGLTEATDTLTSVEYITLAGNTATGSHENDVIDVTAMTTGAVVNYIDGTVSDLAGVTQVTIEGITEMENVWADGNDTVIVADVMNNTRGDAGVDATPAEDIDFMTYMDYDDLVKDTTVRKTFAAQVADDTITQVINQGEYTFSMSKTGLVADVDRIDYSNETGTIATVVDVTGTAVKQNVIVDNNADGVLTDAGDRIDILESVEEIVAASDGAGNDSILDFTGSTQDVEITFQYSGTEGMKIAEDLLENTVRIADGNSNSIDGVPTFVEYYDLNDDDDVAPFSNATWNRIEGSDNAEMVIYEGSEDLVDEAGLDHRYSDDILTLRGGANNVVYHALETSITAVIDIKEDTGTGDGLITATIDFQNGENLALPGAGTHTITSYTSDNTIAAGTLKIEASQDAEDLVSIVSTSDKMFILGTSPGVLDVKIGDLDAIHLTGFENILDAATDDVYQFVDLNTGMGLVDNTAVNDRDTLMVDNDAIGFEAAPADTISLEVLNDELGAPEDTPFDFDVLDITAVTDDHLIVVGDTDATRDLNDDLIVGDLDLIDETQNFTKSIWLTNASVAGGNDSFILDVDAGQLQEDNGDKYFNFGGDGLNLSLVTGTNITINTVDINGTGVTLYGGSGNDNITGAAGNDILVGGAGDDNLGGGVSTEVQGFNIEDAVEASNDNIAGLYNFMGQGNLTISTGAAADSDYTDGHGTIVNGAGSDALGNALASLLNSNLEQVNLDWDTVYGENDGADIASVSYNASTDQLLFNFVSGTNVAGSVDLGYTGVAGDDNTAPLDPVDGGTGGNNTFYGGLGADTIKGGAGADSILVIGAIEKGDYAAGAAAGTIAGTLDLEDVLINAKAVSDVSTDSYDGGAGNDILEIWGDADFSSATVENIETINIHSDVTFAAKHLEDMITINGTEGSTFSVVGETATTVYTYDVVTGQYLDVLGNALVHGPAADITAPKLVGTSPADDAVDVVVGTNLKLTFDEDVAAGTGSFTIVDADGNVVETIAAADAAIAGSIVTLDPVADLAAGTEYNVHADATAIVDAAGNAFAGIADDSFSFTTTLIVGPTDMSADLGTDTEAANLDAATGSFKFTDDATVLNNVIISNFTADDVIEVSNALADDYSITNAGTDVTIEYNNAGVTNTILLTGVVQATDLVYNEASFEAAIGFDAFTVA